MDDTGKYMVWSENIFVMILTHEKFAGFTTKLIADTKSKLATIYALSVDSVDEVNKIVANGVKAGGIEPSEMQDYGFMQQRTRYTLNLLLKDSAVLQTVPTSESS